MIFIRLYFVAHVFFTPHTKDKTAMRTRLASEVVRELESRLARLEGRNDFSSRIAADDKDVKLDLGGLKKAVESVKSEFKAVLKEVGSIQSQLDEDEEVSFDEDEANPLRAEARILQNNLMNHLDLPGGDLGKALSILDESIEAIEDVEAVFNKINARMRKIRK